jgi:SPP1 family predicted phage head-tail adaptor|uniref:Head tail adaptor n=1 Tax=Siphoviridae sp. ctVqj4 TaxID=2826359 RepID=A0A8S5NK34_9CAUD|nr:MAG TPA: Putative head tail adaptor [Siphoviridae sp. ctVqj4]
MSLCDRLKNRIDVYGRTENENELKEKDYIYAKKASIWAEISPQSGRESTGQGNTIYSEINYKFTIRINSLKTITNDMYFMYRGQRYDIVYFNPNYKYRDSVDVFCKLVVEH